MKILCIIAIAVHGTQIFMARSMVGHGSNPAQRNAQRKSVMAQCAEVFALPSRYEPTPTVVD
jgi:hypothetical protein